MLLEILNRSQDYNVAGGVLVLLKFGQFSCELKKNWEFRRHRK